MILIQRGRGGWETSAAGVARIAALAMICVALGVAGCSSKKPEAIGTGVPVGDQGNQTKSTIEDYSKTGMIAGEGGPLSDIHFGYNDYTVQPQDSSILRQNASWLQSHPDANVQVEGNCDERGSDEYNLALGENRANAAKQALVNGGVSPDRVRTVSYGKEKQFCTDHTEACWQQNRRSQFTLDQ